MSCVVDGTWSRTRWRRGGPNARRRRSLGALHRDIGLHAQALDDSGTALAVARETGNQRLEGHALATMGSVRLRQGEQSAAIEFYRQALALADAIGKRYLQTEVLIGLASAGDCSAPEPALDLARQHGFRVHEGNALLAQADAHLRAGRTGPAVETAGRALAIHSETGHRPGSARARELLARLGQIAN